MCVYNVDEIDTRGKLFFTCYCIIFLFFVIKLDRFVGKKIIFKCLMPTLMQKNKNIKKLAGLTPVSMSNISYQFHQHSTSSFYVHRSQKCKKILMAYLYFLCFWDLDAQKLLIKTFCFDRNNLFQQVLIRSLQFLVHLVFPGFANLTPQWQYSQSFLRKIHKTFVTLGLKIFRFLRICTVYYSDNFKG